jgi:hypothetical protein
VPGGAAVAALQALRVYTMGFVAVEVPRATDPAGAARVARGHDRIAHLPSDEFPATRAVAADLARPRPSTTSTSASRG